MHHIQTVSVIVRDGGQVLMVQQPTATDASYWFLPGGRVHNGEFLHDALRREVEEETGLLLGDTLTLAYITHAIGADTTLLALVFEADAYRGRIRLGDPDGLVREATFIPVMEAVHRLADCPDDYMRDPLRDYLRGHSQQGAIHYFRLM